jgi:gluconokinase
MTHGMVIVVMGVSASGKTTVGEALAARLAWDFEDADAWHSCANIAKMRSGQPLTDEDREPWLRALSAAIKKWLAEHRDVVLACSALKASYRDELRRGVPDNQSVRFVYLKGTYQQILERMDERRGHFMPESLLRSQFETLQEPQPAEAFIVDAGLPVAVIVNAVVAGLQLYPAPGSPSRTEGRE